MTVIFSILLSPVFFIVYYAVGEYIFPTKNGAIVFSFCAAAISTYVYYTIRKEVRQLNSNKTEIKIAKEAILSGLLLLEPEKFNNLFPKNSLCDNSYKGVNEDTLLSFLRKNNFKEIEIYSINGLTEGAKDLLNLLNKKYILHTKDEIIKLSENIRLPKISTKKERSYFKRFLIGIKSPAFRKFAIKYGVILFLVGFITPYKIYYLICGLTLFVYGTVSTILPKISQRNQIPYPRF